MQVMESVEEQMFAKGIIIIIDQGSYSLSHQSKTPHSN